MTSQPDETSMILPDTTQMQVLLVRAQAGDLSVLTELRALLDQKPELWQQVGDLAEHAELSMLTLAAGQNLLAREAMKRKLAAFRAELAGPDPTPLERLLVNRIAISWLQVHHADLEAIAGTGRTNSVLGVYAQRRLDSANRRYLLAIRQLATVRRLLNLGQARPAKKGAGKRLTGTGRVQQPQIQVDSSDK